MLTSRRSLGFLVLAALAQGCAASSTRSGAAPPGRGAGRDSLLPAHRIVAFYGHPLDAKLGMLGQLPAGVMLDSLARTAAAWQAADPGRRVRPALHLIAAVALGDPGRDSMYRLRTAASVIALVAGWARERHWLLFLDLQVGRSTVGAEVAHLLPFLARPEVHLGLDPEFDTHGDSLPGHGIGTMDASEVNDAVRLLAGLVSDSGLPPKLLVVHRFTGPMLTHVELIAHNPRVQVVLDMDGFGTPTAKRWSWTNYIVGAPIPYTGFKLFLDPALDFPLMTPAEVLQLRPVPLYIQYQ